MRTTSCGLQDFMIDHQPSDNAEVPCPDSHSRIGPSPSLVSIDMNTLLDQQKPSTTNQFAQAH
ncbi:hypothetical protein PGTUg99_008033 [Puccinia graminis f. sp. tritici]|uniref:Uncharacterized protein n=1 Tax=Puccinia graminis f. sp. tritici TaxID=56615 RepID=A0A5B0Q320_PUCGR|nr:hypothetical protein PGTUg99_008033 [Puccinia graminis f. sp. tritici]